VRPADAEARKDLNALCKDCLFQRILGGIVALAADNPYPSSGGLQLDFVKAAVSGELRRTISQQIITS
jgi:hypothetical protein